MLKLENVVQGWMKEIKDLTLTSNELNFEDMKKTFRILPFRGVNERS